MTWDDKFAIAEKYYEENGNLKVAPGEVREGIDLYNWLMTQKRRYGKVHEFLEGRCTLEDEASSLDIDRVQRLTSIGLVWNLNDYSWERGFAIAEKYYREHGHLMVPKHYEIDGINLSHWIWTQRRVYLGTKGENAQGLTDEQIRRLEEIGMIWAPKSKGFTYYYEQAKKFYDAFGHTDFPDGEVYVHGELLPESGESLAYWKASVTEPRVAGERSVFEVHRKQLCDIGINPVNWKISWEKYFDAAKQFYREYGHLLIPYSYKTEDGKPLGKWISRQRMSKNGTMGPPLTEERIRRLEEIGMVWSAPKGAHPKSLREKANKASKEIPEDESDQASGRKRVEDDGGTVQTFAQRRRGGRKR